ncbi:MAG: hypothetical protein GXP38_14725, partial [Chloroflexi bacterium]|nr:hypothetical protein [Chloroflexota bacterium]
MDNQLLDQCLDSLAAGESLEACLEKYPEQRQELEPLLRAALRLRAAKAITAPPHLRQSGRQRLLERIESESHTASKQAGWAQSWQNLVATLQQRLLTPALAPVVLVLAILFLGTTATAYAAQSALPTSPIYPLKRLTETVRISLASDPLEQRLQFAGRRLNEAQALQSSAQQAYIPQLIKEYEHELRLWREQSEEKGLSDRARVLSQLEVQLSTLQQLGSQAPAEQKALIEQQEEMLTSIIRNIGPSTTPSTSATPSSTPTPTPAITPTPLLPLSSNESPTPTATSAHDADEGMTTPTDTSADETRTPTITREHRPHGDMM